MKLNKEDKQLLKDWGYPEDDFRQIEEATTKTKYELGDEKISRTKVIEILGRELYLSGIARSAFHWSAYRTNENGQGIYFNSSKLFE